MCRFAFALALVGCSRDSDDADSGDTDTDDTDVVPVVPEEASISLVLTEPSYLDPEPKSIVSGLFVDSTFGWLNLATCLTSPVGICIDTEPTTPDTYVVAHDKDPALLASLDTREVGTLLVVGPWTAPYTYDAVTDVGFYFGSRPAGADPFGQVGPSFSGGTWGFVELPELVPFPTPIEVTSHPLDQLADLYADQVVPLRWTPGVDGEVHLLVDGPSEKRLYLLEDDGAYDLDLAALLLADGERVDLVVERRTHAAAAVGVHTLDFEVLSTATIAGVWREIGTRIELTDVPDTCDDARDAPALTSGNYTGSIAGLGDDVDPGEDGCTGFAAAGPDALFPLHLLPQDFVEVDYRLVDGDASLYLLTDCDSADACLVGADVTGIGGTESIEWLHDADAPTTVWLAVDSFAEADTTFQLDVTITSLGGAILVPTCVEALDAGPAGAGAWHGTLAGNTNVLEPECAAPAPSGEGMTQVYLDPGQTLTATVVTPAGGNPKLYLLYNCAIAESCTLAGDTGPDDAETLVYTNATPFSEFLYLVLDGEMGIGEYFLELTIQ